MLRVDPRVGVRHDYGVAIERQQNAELTVVGELEHAELVRQRIAAGDPRDDLDLNREPLEPGAERRLDPVDEERDERGLAMLSRERPHGHREVLDQRRKSRLVLGDTREER